MPIGTTLARLLMLMVLVLVGSIATASDERGGEESKTAAHGGPIPKATHEVMLFIGVTDDRGEDAVTWGGEYGYSFMDHYAVGVFFDRAEGQLRASVLGLAFWAHVGKGFLLMFGPAVEFRDEAHGAEGEDGFHGDGGSKRHFLARVGVGYTAFTSGSDTRFSPSSTPTSWTTRSSG